MGRVALYIKNELDVDIMESSNNQNETIWIKLTENKSKGIIVGVCYRPPNSEEVVKKAYFKVLNK